MKKRTPCGRSGLKSAIGRPSRMALKYCSDLLRLDGFVDLVGAEQCGETAFRLLARFGVGRIRPEYRRGVADLDTMATVPFEKSIERRRIGESGGFGDRGVVALLVAIGGEGVEIEGDDRGAGRCAPHTPLIAGCSRATGPRSPVMRQAASVLVARRRRAAPTARARPDGRGCRCFSAARSPARKQCSGPSSPRASRAGQNVPAASSRESAAGPEVPRSSVVRKLSRCRSTNASCSRGRALASRPR